MFVPAEEVTGQGVSPKPLAGCDVHITHTVSNSIIVRCFQGFLLVESQTVVVCWLLPVFIITVNTSSIKLLFLSPIKIASKFESIRWDLIVTS